jgi:hypothetical protein
MKKVQWNDIKAQVMDGETPLDAINRKIRRIHGKNHFLHRDSWEDGGGPLYRLAKSCKDGAYLFGGLHRITEI